MQNKSCAGLRTVLVAAALTMLQSLAAQTDGTQISGIVSIIPAILGASGLIFFCIIIVVGCVSPIDAAWDIADTFNGLMAIPNFIALFALSPVVFKLTKEHFAEVDRLKAK